MCQHDSEWATEGKINKIGGQTCSMEIILGPLSCALKLQHIKFCFIS